MQIGGLKLVAGAKGQFAAEFSGDSSRAAVWAVGPHGAGNIISYSIWLKTTKSSANMIVLHYGIMAKGMKACFKDEFSLYLDHGVPTIYRCNISKLVPDDKRLSLADGVWHHVLITMPFSNCRFSKILMYIDGMIVATELKGKDENLFFVNGRLSIGGFGYSSDDYEDKYPDHTPFVGTIDDVQVYGRTLYKLDIKRLSRRDFKIFTGSKCSGVSSDDLLAKKELTKAGACAMMCKKNWSCSGFEMIKKNLIGTSFTCNLYRKSPGAVTDHNKKTCGVGPV